MARLLIRGAQVVLPSGIERTNVLAEDGVVADIAASAHAAADEVVDAAGLHLLPGAIDDQVHFREPGLTHKEDLRTGSIAAAKGGVTTFLEMPNTNPTTTTVERLAEKLALAATKCVVDFGFYIGATPDNIAELRAAQRAPGIKIFIGSSTGDLLVDDQEALERIFAETTLPICAHCEDETTVRANAARLGGGKSVEDHSRIRDHAAAEIAVRRAIDLAQRHRHPFHILHMSTAKEVELLRDAGPFVTGEACVHHLWFHRGDYARLGTRIQMNPSIKDPEDIEALWAALADGTIQVVATDHAPHTLEEKARPYPQSPSGLPAVENSLGLMLDAANRGRIALERVVDAMCAQPARIWSLAGKGRIEEGFDADLVLVDMEKPHTIRDEDQAAKSRWSPWHGTTLRGWPVRTILRGRTVMLDGVVDESPGGREARFAR